MKGFHALIGFLSILLGATMSFYTIPSRWGHIMDIYHDVVIAPMILYFAVTLLPVIYLGGTIVEKVSTICFVLFWIVLVVYDIMNDRMNQRRWLKERGINLLK